MEAEPSTPPRDIFEQLMGEDEFDRSMESERSHKWMHQSMHHRSTHDLNRRSDFRKIPNTSSSNDRLIPSSIKHDSSR